MFTPGRRKLHHESGGFCAGWTAGEPRTAVLPGVALCDALDAAPSEVTVIPQGGPVPELAFGNRAGRGILVVANEEVVGAKQSRSGARLSISAALLFAQQIEVAPVL